MKISKHHKINSIFLTITVFCVLICSCKKVSKYPIRLNGIWYSPRTGCNELLIIKADGIGEHVKGSPTKGCNTKGKGKVKTTNNKLYFGYTNFDFISKPTNVCTIDSIQPPLRYSFSKKKYKVIAEMTLKESFFNGSAIKTYYKYIEY